MAREERRCLVTDATAGRVDRVVQDLCACSRAAARGLVDHGAVAVDGQPVTLAGLPVAVGATVVVRFDPDHRMRPKPRERSVPGLRVVFEDPHLIVVDKPADLLTVATERGETNTLFDAVWRHLSPDRHRSRRPTVVHRLDRGTSGLLVFGKNERVAAALHDALRLRKPEREYVALVAGNVASAEGTLQSRLATGKNLDRYSVPAHEPGEDAVTHFQVTARLAGATLVRVRLETGRRHQIRIHFAEAGHPVLGDARYRPDVARHPAWTAPRLALHAALLAFVHPVTHTLLRFEAKLPAEFERFLAATPPAPPLATR